MNIAINVRETMAIHGARKPTFKSILGRPRFGINERKKLNDE
jgi:hypothetical protein